MMKMSPPFKGPRLASESAKSGEPSFFTPSKACGTGKTISDNGTESEQMGGTNRRMRSMGSQGSMSAGAFKGYGPVDR